MYCREKKTLQAVQPIGVTRTTSRGATVTPEGGTRPSPSGSGSGSPCSRSPRPLPPAPVLQIERVTRRDCADTDDANESHDNDEKSDYSRSAPKVNNTNNDISIHKDKDKDKSTDKDLTVDTAAPLSKNDEYRRPLSQRSCVEHIDFNENGVDDLEELEALIEEAMPDKSVVANLLDWLTVAIVLALLILRAEYVATARRLHELFLDLAEEHGYSSHMTDIVSRFDSLDRLLDTQRLLLMLVMFTGMTQFFRYLSFDSRLGIVAETVLCSARDLLPVLLIFVIVLGGYSVLGAALFGHSVASWATVGGSMLNLMIFIVGEYGTYMDSK